LERFTLYELRFVLKESLSTIAKKMGRTKSTLSRELRRNRISPWRAKDQTPSSGDRRARGDTLLA
ncbi:MAG: helix-turn-helix domain-containing protein, partial [Deinococcota bacterium]|nr:helix-turn-helix domain-containing protein [Deinococcota bacterium]